MISNSNKVAIVTGASSGIGTAIAYNLAKQNIAVTLVARRLDKLNLIVNDLLKSGYNAIAIQADLSKKQEISKAIKLSHKHWGSTDILINNAGYCKKAGFFEDNIKEWEKMWQINVLAPCIAMYEVLKYFDKTAGGIIVNISSTSAHRVIKGGSFYSATKSALKTISETLRKELVEIKNNTRIVCISPGLVNTNFGQENSLNIPDNNDKNKLDPEDIANLVIHILNLPTHVAIQDIILRSVHQYE